jgi:Starch-binding associating with outer membrane
MRKAKKMMRKKLANAAVLVGLVWAVTACDNLTDINENPNAPTDVGPEFLLPQAIQNAVQPAFGAGQYLSHTGIWPQQIVQLQYPDEELGEVRSSRMEGYWNGYFTGPLKDIQTVIDKGVETGSPNAEAVGRIWKSWIFHIVTDLWGDVPYSEALDVENFTPVYDTQAAIYAGMLSELTAAATQLDPGGTGFGAGDLIYGNDFAAWGKFANSLRMRLAMRLSEVDPATAQSEFVAAFNAGGFTSNADNAMLQYPGSPYENPLYENYLGRDDHGISATMVDTLASLNDPRLALYAEPATEDGVYRGHQNGRVDLPAGQSMAWFSRIGNFWRADGASTPTAIMTYSEVLFLQAEAAARGWIAGDPATLYTAAIQANMDQYDAQGVGPSDAEITAYLAQPAVAYTGMNDIYLQKWIALWMNGPEAWSQVRRTGVPNLLPGADFTLSRLPVRFSYPDSEQALNKANMDAAIARQGGGLDLVTLVWWDVN